MTGRDWTKERWRKQYIREPLQHRAWPVMARGLRELLNALAEDDGTLVRGAEDPVAALLRGLNAQEYELELVEAALGLLLREGFLEGDDHAIRIPDLPRAQAQREHVAAPSERPLAPTEARSTSTERVRAFRARQRERNAAGVSTAPVSEEATETAAPAEAVSSDVAAVSSSVSPSRGDRDLKPSGSSEIETKNKKLDHLHPASASAAALGRARTARM